MRLKQAKRMGVNQSPGSPAKTSPSHAVQPRDGAPRWEKALFVFLYGLTSASLVFVNKTLFKSYELQNVGVLLVLQMLGNVLITWTFHLFGLLSLPTEALHLSPHYLQRVAPLSLFFTLDILVGMSALGRVNIPMFTALRKLSLLATLILERVVLLSRPSWDVAASVCVMLAGVLVAAAGDLTFDLEGYAFAIAAAVTTATYRIMVKQLGMAKESSFTLLYLNAAITLPFLCLLCMYSGDFDAFMVSPYLHDFGFQCLLLASCSFSFLMTFAMFRCTIITSPLTTGIAGQVKNYIVLIPGFFVVERVPVNPLNVLGHLLCALASVAYFNATFRRSTASSST